MESMSWKAREHYDNEAREKLREHYSTNSRLAEMLNSAYEGSVHRIERNEAEMMQRYERVPRLLEQTCTLAGMEPERMLTICRRISATDDVEWYEVLGTINAYYRVNAALDREEKK